jgi:hypothetical protein
VKFKCLALFLTLATFGELTAADGVFRIEQLDSSVNIKKVAGATDRYAFEICNTGTCIPLGNPAGYQGAKIEALSGRWQQLAAVGMGLVEGVVIAYSAGSGFAIGCGTESFLSFVGGGALGVAVPSAAVSHISVLDPFTNFSAGGNKAWIRNSVDQMIYDGSASLVLYLNPDWTRTRAVGKAVEAVLKDL